MFIGQALHSTSHAVHIDGKNLVHVFELPDSVATKCHEVGLFEPGVPNHDVNIMIVTGPGKPWMKNKMPPAFLIQMVAFLSQLGVNPGTVLSFHISSGSGIMATLHSRGLFDGHWEPA